MTCLCLLGLAACTPNAAIGPGPASESHRGEGMNAGAGGAAPAGLAPWRHWQPNADDGAQTAESGVRAVVLALHGFNDYSNAFQDFAAYGSERGIAVHAYDQRGFGANPDRGLWPGTERLTSDLRQAIGRLRRIYGDAPLYVLGESMGGAVTIVTATGEGALDVDGIVLSAPAVWGGRHMNPFYRMTLWLAATLAPGWTLSGGGLDISPSDNIEMLRAFSADPLVIKATRTDSIAGLVALMDRALAAAPALDQEVLLLIGEKDEIVPAGALDDFRTRLETPDLTVISYPDGYHMLLRDLQRARVFEDIVAWIDRRPSPTEARPLRASAKP